MDATRKKVEEAAQLEAGATGIVLTGRIKDGKIEFDQKTLDEVAKKYPTGDRSFIAMNAPSIRSRSRSRSDRSSTLAWHFNAANTLRGVHRGQITSWCRHASRSRM